MSWIWDQKTGLHCRHPCQTLAWSTERQPASCSKKVQWNQWISIFVSEANTCVGWSTVNIKTSSQSALSLFSMVEPAPLANSDEDGDPVWKYSVKILPLVWGNTSCRNPGSSSMWPTERLIVLICWQPLGSGSRRSWRVLQMWLSIYKIMCLQQPLRTSRNVRPQQRVSGGLHRNTLISFVNGP